MGRTTTDVILSEFEGHYMHLKPEKGTLWLTTREIGEALEYENPRVSIHTLYRAHADEFDNDSTRVIDTITGENTPIRIREFSIEGVMLLAMFSEQPLAKKLRKWARKVLAEVAVTGRYGTGGDRVTRTYIPPSGERVHWTETLSPADCLKLADMRMQVWIKLADRPRNKCLWNALYATFGGPSGYVDYLRKKDLPVPETPEQWEEFYAQAEGPGGWFRDEDENIQ